MSKQKAEGKLKGFTQNNTYSVSFSLDRETILELNKACASKGERSKFVREAIRKALGL